MRVCLFSLGIGLGHGGGVTKRGNLWFCGVDVVEQVNFFEELAKCNDCF